MNTLLEQIKRPAFDGAKLKIENFTSIYNFKPDDVVYRKLSVWRKNKL